MSGWWETHYKLNLRSKKKMFIRFEYQYIRDKVACNIIQSVDYFFVNLQRYYFVQFVFYISFFRPKKSINLN